MKGDSIAIYANILIEKIDDPNNPIVIKYDLANSKFIDWKFVGKGEENESIILNVLGGTEEDNGILVFMGKQNNENLICFNVHTGFLTGKTYL